jgi:hypothetical protein
MMRKLLLALVLVIMPLTASAEQDREMLLTPDGTLFTIQQMWASDYAFTTASNSFLVLSQRRGDDVVDYIVPATLTAGVHRDPALAYDTDSKTLFVFWQHTYTIFSSELSFIAFRNDGTWSDATTFGNPTADNQNLRIAVTRTVEVTDGDKKTLQPEVNVHAVWWEFNSSNRKQSARYALLTIENGAVAVHTEPRDLTSFLASPVSRATAKEANEDEALLRNPALFTTPTQDAIDVVFGDVESNSLSRVRVRPTKPSLEARIRIPVGVREQNVGQPRFRSNTDSAERISAINGDPDRVAFYQKDGEAIRYVMYKNEKWTSTQSIALDSQISSEAAVDAIRRLLNEQ